MQWQQEEGREGEGKQRSVEVVRGQGGVEKKKKEKKRRKNRSWNRGNFNKCTERRREGEQGERKRSERRKCSSPNDGRYAATVAELPIIGWHGTNTSVSVMKGEEGKGEKEGKSLRGERTGTPLRWPPTETSCSWRVYPHHYILARSHAARHSQIMSCFKKRKELFLLFSFSFILLSSLKFVCGHVEPRRACCKHTHADRRAHVQIIWHK